MMLGYFLNHSDHEVLSSIHLSEKLGLPHPTVSKLAKHLCKKSLLSSVQGPLGGYKLSHLCLELSIGEIIEKVEGPIALTLCAQAKPNTCQSLHVCQISEHMKLINTVFRSALMAFPFKAFLASVPSQNMQPHLEELWKTLIPQDPKQEVHPL